MTGTISRTPDEWCKQHDVTVHGPDGWRRDSKSWDEPITEAEFWDRVAVSSCEMPVRRPGLGGVSAGSTADTGVQVNPGQTTDGDRVSGLTDEMIETAAAAITQEWFDELSAREMARIVLESALAGRTVVDLPSAEEWTVHHVQPDDVLLIGNVQAGMPEIEDLVQRVQDLYPERRLIFFGGPVDVQILREVEQSAGGDAR